MSGGKVAVVALGGNALSGPGDDGSIRSMRRHVRRAVEALFKLRQQGYRLVITHGNGPQVGAQLLKNDAGKQIYHIPAYPLDVLVADTQGEIGYLIESEWRNLLREKKRDARVAAQVSMIEVDPSDPAFAHPVKRVGKTYYDEEEVRRLEREKSWQFLQETKNGRTGWRRVVPSPVPQAVVNADALRALLEAGFDIIAGGGGGIPVSRDGRGLLQPVEAVIDKDLTSALMARTLKADRLIILTDVSQVYLNYGKPGQKAIDRVSVDELEEYIDQGQFGAGNMLPKIRAAMDFARRSGNPAVITDFEGLSREGRTQIWP